MNIFTASPKPEITYRQGQQVQSIRVYAYGHNIGQIVITPRGWGHGRWLNAEIWDVDKVCPEGSPEFNAIWAELHKAEKAPNLFELQSLLTRLNQLATDDLLIVLGKWKFYKEVV